MSEGERVPPCRRLALVESRKVLVVLERGDNLTWLSLRNEPSVHLLAVDQLNTYDVLLSDDVVFTRGAYEVLVGGAIDGAEAVEVEVAVKEKPAKKAAAKKATAKKTAAADEEKPAKKAAAPKVDEAEDKAADEADEKPAKKAAPKLEKTEEPAAEAEVVETDAAEEETE